MEEATSTIDVRRALLKAAGWSTAETDFVRNDIRVHLVTCVLGNEQITGEGDTQIKAWQEAVRAASLA